MAKKSSEFASSLFFFIEQILWKLTLPTIDMEMTFFPFPQYQLSTF